MSDWRNLCRGARHLAVEGDTITVACEEGRRHQVKISETGATLELMGVVVRPSVLATIDDASMRAWQRNRSTQLVGFRVDRRGWLVGEAWVPKAGLEREEFLLYVERVAAECDRFEWELTGKDRR